jgi:hypothetical protein
MPQTVPTQHPAVVLRSHYRQLRALLTVAMIAIVGLSAAVVILADDGATSTATPVSARTEPADGPRYIHPPGQRYDPGPSARSRTEGVRTPLVAPSPTERHQKPGLDGPGMRR